MSAWYEKSNVADTEIANLIGSDLFKVRRWPPRQRLSEVKNPYHSLPSNTLSLPSGGNGHCDGEDQRLRQRAGP